MSVRPFHLRFISFDWIATTAAKLHIIRVDNTMPSSRLRRANSVIGTWNRSKIEDDHCRVQPVTAQVTKNGVLSIIEVDPFEAFRVRVSTPQNRGRAIHITQSVDKLA